MINVKIVLLICQLKVFEIFVDMLDMRLKEKKIKIPRLNFEPATLIMGLTKKI